MAFNVCFSRPRVRFIRWDNTSFLAPACCQSLPVSEGVMCRVRETPVCPSGTALTTFEGLDDVEYYRHGIEYGKEIERQEKQKDLGWTVAPRLVEVDDKHQLQIALADADGKPVVGCFTINQRDDATAPPLPIVIPEGFEPLEIDGHRKKWKHKSQPGRSGQIGDDRTICLFSALF